MRFIALRIRDFRGVEDCRIAFAERGVTLVHGPNEAGKSSLFEAVALLFNFKTTSAADAVKRIKPVNRDVGSEIELEAESGGIHFTYRKVFNKGKRTELNIHAPVPGNFTGDDAHERASRILEETLDKTLWDALTLSVAQGEALAAPKLPAGSGLMSLLDQAAGAGGGDTEAEGIYDRVRTEYEKYYAKNHRELHILAKADTDVAAAREQLASLRNALADLEKKIDRAAATRRDLNDMTVHEADKKRDLEKYRERNREADILAGSVREDRFALQAAENRRRETERDWDDREKLIAAAAAAREELAALADGGAGLAAAFAEAEAGIASLAEALGKAETRWKTAEENLAAARRAAEYARLLPRREELRRRKNRLDASRREMRQAGEELAGNRMSEKTLEAMRAADAELAREEAKLSAVAPRVTLRALADCRVLLDGEETLLGAGETATRSVAGDFHLALPDILSLTVEAGGGAEEAGRRARAARDRLDRLYADACVADFADACAALERRKALERQNREHERLEKDCLGGLTYGELEQKLLELEETLAAHPSARADGPPPDGDAADAALAAAEEECGQARAAWEAARDRHAAAREKRDRLAADLGEARGRRGMTEKARTQRETELAAARGVVSDAALDEARKRAAEAVEAARARTRAGEAALNEKNPEQIRAMLETIGGSLEALRRRRTEKEKEQTALAKELELLGERGLYEEALQADLDLERKTLARETLRRKAAAARLLFEIMREERERVRRAYAAPLRDKVEELGRLVFNASFRVEIGGDDLGMTARTLDGVTVPFASLSGGTREQMAILFRTACAMLVSEKGGMPLILDDALGYADRDRAQLMGAAIARAARLCQIIVFTCAPERYDNVGEVTVVELRRSAPATDMPAT